MHIRTAWSDYFTGTPTLLQTTEYNSRQNPSGTGVYISNCLFSSITSSDTGGALYCTSVTYFLVESTSFFSCKTSSSRGAIYFSNSGGQSVLHQVCAYDCCTTGSNNYQFAYIYVKNDASGKNYVNYSSIVRCVNGYSSAYYILGLDSGNICLSAVNISLNKCHGRSGIICWPFGNSVTCSFSFTSFSDNYATYCTCIYLNKAGSDFEIKSCNILRNTQGSLGSEGTIFTNGYLKIEDSCILDNKADRIFYQHSSYSITLSNCTIDSTSNNGYLTTKNTVTKSFILALNHISTQNCHSEYDSAGNLTPIIQTPFSSRKQIRLCTCGGCFNNYRLTDSFESTFILIFNFIHLSSSNYH
jgi:hypothetical protein